MNPFLMGNPSALGQQTLAGRIIVGTSAGNGMRAAPKRRRKASKKSAPRTRRASPAKRARMVKGSKAAKAYMAKIRRKRRK
jgi:hypothetical protein